MTVRDEEEHSPMSTRIKIIGIAPPTIVEAPMPLDDSLRWNSTHENNLAPRAHVFLAQSAYAKCVTHTKSDLENEVGGALIGQVRIDPNTERQYIFIQDILPALYTKAGQTHVTFTQDTLVHLNNEVEDRFPRQRIVGWYHTHPRLGVFLSSYDTWLHHHFFNDCTQVALVVDPYHEQGGFFVWQNDCELDPIHYTGFYEWSDVSDDSVIEWNNLTPQVDEAALELA